MAAKTRVAVKLRGKKKALDAMGRKSKRLNKWKPIAKPLHQIYIDDLNKFYARKFKVGKMENLGPSVINAGHPNHYFVVKNGSSAKGLTRRTSWQNRAYFEMGTDVVYARRYSWWRVKNPNGAGKPLMTARAKPRKQMGELIINWVATGKKR